mmetsp:Transcript_7742/g.11167  ORF Transcript_7742/g.11167 Transcript_7742/m.11167 type:complete len:218 (+) Transcript_7742:459-1112(+)
MVDSIQVLTAVSNPSRTAKANTRPISWCGLQPGCHLTCPFGLAYCPVCGLIPSGRSIQHVELYRFSLHRSLLASGAHLTPLVAHGSVFICSSSVVSGIPAYPVPNSPTSTSASLCSILRISKGPPHSRGTRFPPMSTCRKTRSTWSSAPPSVIPESHKKISISRPKMSAAPIPACRVPRPPCEMFRVMSLTPNLSKMGFMIRWNCIVYDWRKWFPIP